ncbi:MAG: signal recognition particle subunit SRP19/SEC65 family protein [Nitrososphaerota archaeon]|nr:hypothetical protein [Candidatus Calditenuaceae archaeon]MDW8073359.1 signal recognition particle subunit SRP19/SEC65 family protein [Nitrososphaerota archaeon]
MIRREGFILWTTYFDANLSRSEGRRVPLRLAVKNPSQEMLIKAAQRLGWPAEPLDKRHPSKWWKSNASIVIKPPKGIRKKQAVKIVSQSLWEKR